MERIKDPNGLTSDSPGSVTPNAGARRTARSRSPRAFLGAFLSEFQAHDRHDAAGFIAEAPLPRQTAKQDSRLKKALFVADLLAAVLALTLSLQIFGDSGLIRPGTLLLPLVVIGAKAAGLYDRDQHVLAKRTLDDAPTLLNVTALFVLAFWLADSALVSSENVPPREVALLLVLTFGLLLLVRASAREVIARTGSPERCLIVGDEEAAALIARKLECEGRNAGVPVGRVPFDSNTHHNGGPSVVADTAGLGLATVEHEVDRIIIAPGPEDHESALDVIRMGKALGVKVSVMPRLLEVVGSAVEFDYLGGVTLLGLRREGLSRSSWMLKRAFDLCVACVSSVLLAPLVFVIALAIKLDSRGPVLFRQRRIGRNGSEFVMLKFRTMRIDAERARGELDGRNETLGLFKVSDDPRVTRVGRILRSTSLDELAQLLNVFRGEMSLVGPRPLVPDEDSKVAGWDRRRLYVPPGMTGHWQIMGGTRVPLDEMVKIDYLYGANWSLWDDLKTLLRTIPHVVMRRGM